MTILMLCAGLALLIAGGELLVRGASRLAISLGISTLVVGLTVVAFACLPVFFTGATIARWERAVFLGYCVACAAFLVMTAEQHAPHSHSPCRAS